MLESIDAKRVTDEIRDAGTHFLHSSLVSPARTIYSAIDRIAPGVLPELSIETPQARSAGAQAGEMLGTAALVAGAFLATRGACRKAAQLIESRSASQLSGSLVHNHVLALQTTFTGQALGAEASSLTALAARPLPRLDHLPRSLAGSVKLEGNALKQSQDYVNTGLVTGKLEDGVNLASVVNSRGFNPSGLPQSSIEKFIVIDRTKDPVLKAVLDDAAQRYAGMKAGPEMAADLSSYVARLMNRHNLSGETLASVYEDMLRKSSSNAIPLGFFLERGSGVCLPRSALFKTIADDIGLNTRLREGLLGIKNPRPHVWTEVNFGSKYQVYDPSHAPNPLFRYISVKH